MAVFKMLRASNQGISNCMEYAASLCLLPGAAACPPNVWSTSKKMAG